MPLQIIKGDLVSMATDAIVYAETPQPFSLFNFNPLMIHKTGKEILNTRDALKPIIIGQAKIAQASLLDCKYIIHTSAPAWHGGSYHELAQLRTCYEKVFALALENDCKTIGMPIIASDKLGYPKPLSQKTAFECIKDFLQIHNDIEITLVLPGKTGIMLPGNRFTNVNLYLNKNYVKPDEKSNETEKDSSGVGQSDSSESKTFLSSEEMKTFAGKLSGYMESSGISKSDLCFKANITPAKLEDILQSSDAGMTKQTVIALAMALELSAEEFTDFLHMAGYELTNDSKFDLIIKYCISEHMYDLFDVNQILFRFEQELLG